MKNREQMQIEILEKRLYSVLHPVEPEENFIKRIKSRLLISPAISLERNNQLIILLMICFAFFGGLVFIYLLNRLFSIRNERKFHL